MESLTTKNEKELLKSYLSLDINATVVFLSQENKLDLQSLFSKDKVKIFYEIDDTRKEKFILDYIHLNKRDLDSDALKFLLDNLDNNKRVIKNELDKVLSFVTERTILGSDIEEFLSHSKEENIWTLISCLADKNLSKSLVSFSIIFLRRGADFDMILLLANLSSQMKKILEFKKIYKIKKSLSSAFDQMFIKNKKQKDTFLSFEKNYSEIEIKRAIKIIASLDVLLRVEGNFSKVYIELFIYEFVLKSKESIFLKPRKKLFL